MARKGKTKRRRESIKIDSNRFAYDVIVYAAKRFNVDGTCLVKLKGTENDYGCADFCLAVGRLVLRYQIAVRFTANYYFESCYKNHGFKSVRNVEIDLINIINMVVYFKRSLIKDGLDPVVMSLSVASEFILFLYSKNFKTLYLKQVAEFWLKNQFLSWKNDFNTDGGPQGLYEKGKDCSYLDSFYDEFIETHCLNYEESANNKQLWVQFETEEGKIKRPQSNLNDSPEKSYFRYKMTMCNIPRPPPSTSKRASGIDLSQNTGLGITPHEELLRDILPNDDTSSQSLTVERPKHPRRSSGGQKRRNITSNLGSKVEQGIGDSRLDSSRNRQEPAEEYKGSSSQDTRQGISNSPQSSIAYEATPSQNPTGARPKDSQIHGRGSSDRRRPKSKPSSLSSLEQGIRELGLDSSGTKH